MFLAKVSPKLIEKGEQFLGHVFASLRGLVGEYIDVLIDIEHAD